MELPFGASAYDRERGNFSSLPVINMVAEQTPVEEGVVLQSRPGLEAYALSMGAGPVRTLFQYDNVLGNKLFGISGEQLYSSDGLIGTVVGTGPAKLAGYESLLFATAGERLYSYDGATLATVALPDDNDVIDLCVGASRLVAIGRLTGKFYWTDTLTDDINALSFATAENSPDQLKACLFLGDTLILFGSRTVEFWPANTSGDTPFQPLVGKVLQKGIRDTGCATLFNSTFAWVTETAQVCIGDPNNIISTPDLSAKINDSAQSLLWSFMLEGVELLALRLDTETWIYNPVATSWSTFESYGETNWLPACTGGAYFGSGKDGSLYHWSDTHSDFGGILERRFRAGLPIDGAALPLSNVLIRTNSGRTTYTSGEYADPIVELRTSKDGGFTWSKWRAKSLGLQGKYRLKVQWRSLGLFSYPGLFLEVRVTDPVPFRVSSVRINELYGGV
jgi:hypothetical protein